MLLNIIPDHVVASMYIYVHIILCSYIQLPDLTLGHYLLNSCFSSPSAFTFTTDIFQPSFIS